MYVNDACKLCNFIFTHQFGVLEEEEEEEKDDMYQEFPLLRRPGKWRVAIAHLTANL